MSFFLYSCGSSPTLSFMYSKINNITARNATPNIIIEYFMLLLYETIAEPSAHIIVVPIPATKLYAEYTLFATSAFVKFVMYFSLAHRRILYLNISQHMKQVLLPQLLYKEVLLLILGQLLDKLLCKIFLLRLILSF